MSSVLDGVNLRTQMVGRNRLEILLFFLNGGQRYGINVFKVHEVIQRPALTRLPNSHPIICGVATLRGRTIPIFDMGKAMGQKPLVDEEAGIVIVAEYNRSVQGFLVRAVDRIININWEKVVPPPESVGHQHFLTAVAHVDNEMVGMIDVERVLTTVVGSIQLADGGLEAIGMGGNHLVLVADDSTVARNQIKATMDHIGVESHLCKNGKEAYAQLLEWLEHDPDKFRRLAMVVSDIEMPEMDGYTLTRMIRGDERLRGLYVMLHTSLSGLFNNDLVKQVDANAFVPKFDPKDLARQVMQRIDSLNGQAGQAA